MYWSCVVVVVDQVQKRPEKFSEELLSDGTQENDSGFWESLTRCLSLSIKLHPLHLLFHTYLISAESDGVHSLPVFLSPEGLQEV